MHNRAPPLSRGVILENEDVPQNMIETDDHKGPKIDDTLFEGSLVRLDNLRTRSKSIFVWVSLFPKFEWRARKHFLTENFDFFILDRTNPVAQNLK